MNDETQAFRLSSANPDLPAPVLTGVQALGRLDGVLFELTLRQHYRNAGEVSLEVIYTFPLPLQAVLLDVACELNGERKVGTAVARRQAEQRYEEALADGDAPVLVETLGGGLHTANLGNLRPGDEIVLEVRYAQLLAFEQGRLRVAIPTTIAPRYGHAELSGLQAQQIPASSLEPEYPLALSVTLAGSLASAAVECPTHRCTLAPVEGGLRLELAAPARLDRDVVIVVVPAEPWPSFVLRAPDAMAPAGTDVVLAALRPGPAPARAGVALKVLVDCSGSMGGDSMVSARKAILQILSQLRDTDHVSFSRFGSSVEHDCSPMPATPRALRHLKAAIQAIDADLGGTEMEAALESVFALAVPLPQVGADVLIVTDGQIWQSDKTLAAARASGHRIFAIGVGSAPAEGVLRPLAEASGGACEFATPGESLEAAATRMLARIRQACWRNPRVDWGATPLWQTALPASVFGEDTVLVFAGWPRRSTLGRVRLLVNDASGAEVEAGRADTEVACTGDTLARLAAAARLALDDAQACDIAVAYRLASRHTHYLLVHERDDAHGSVELASTYRVDSMLAAGWGATGSLAAAASQHFSFRGQVRRERFEGWIDMPCFMRRSETPDDVDRPQRIEPRPQVLDRVVQAVVAHLRRHGEMRDLAASCGAVVLADDRRNALDAVVALGGSADLAWLVLACCLHRGIASPADPELALLRSHLDAVDPALATRCRLLCDRLLRRRKTAAAVGNRSTRNTPAADRGAA